MKFTRQSIKVPNFASGFGKHELVYYDCGDPMSNNVVVCVHGLTRNARDFDVLAAELATRNRRVLSISMAGRGESAWLEDTADYNYLSYVADCLRILDNFHIRQVDWVGTSMGGIIGMMIAAEHPKRIRKLVLNDIGIRLNKAALERIYSNVRNAPLRFTNRAEAEIWMREAYKGFGITDPAQWQQFVSNSLITNPDHSVNLAFDPRILDPLKGPTKDFTDIVDVNIAYLWDKIRIPTLIIRGEQSDILDAETVSAMRSTNPHSESAIIKDVGHAPALVSPDQVKLVADWLVPAGSPWVPNSGR